MIWNDHLLNIRNIGSYIMFKKKSQRACDLLLKKKFFILRPFLKTGIRSMLCFTSI